MREHTQEKQIQVISISGASDSRSRYHQNENHSRVLRRANHDRASQRENRNGRSGISQREEHSRACQIKNCRRKTVNRQKKTFVLAAATSLLIILFVLSMNGMDAQATDAGYSYKKCYASVRIETGDSLWSIASDYTDGSAEEIMACMDEIRTINHIGKFETIKAGDYLAVPYYVLQ